VDGLREEAEVTAALDELRAAHEAAQKALAAARAHASETEGKLAEAQAKVDAAEAAFRESESDANWSKVQKARDPRDRLELSLANARDRLESAEHSATEAARLFYIASQRAAIERCDGWLEHARPIVERVVALNFELEALERRFMTEAVGYQHEQAREVSRHARAEYDLAPHFDGRFPFESPRAPVGPHEARAALEHAVDGEIRRIRAEREQAELEAGWARAQARKQAHAPDAPNAEGGAEVP